MGKILLEGENLMTENIPEDSRDKSIDDFCKMREAAVVSNDDFFALEELYGDLNAPIYRYFRSWQEFIQQEYGKGVSLNAWQSLHQIFVSCTNLQTVPSIEDFFQKEEPLAKGGFGHPGMDPDLLVDVATWRVWREKWFCEHQELVDWTGKEECYFLNDDVVEEILSKENRAYIINKLRESGEEEITDDKICDFFASKDVCHVDKNVSKPLKDNAVSIFFHTFVMNSHASGGDRQGYAKEIGSRICRSNYYIELPELAAMEKEAAPKGRDNTQRTIYGFHTSLNGWKFVSIDYEKGMFEFHDDDGTHIGEYRFDSSKNADAQLDHDLRCVDVWKKQH